MQKAPLQPPLSCTSLSCSCMMIRSASWQQQQQQRQQQRHRQQGSLGSALFPARACSWQLALCCKTTWSVSCTMWTNPGLSVVSVASTPPTHTRHARGACSAPACCSQVEFETHKEPQHAQECLQRRLLVGCQLGPQLGAAASGYVVVKHIAGPCPDGGAVDHQLDLKACKRSSAHNHIAMSAPRIV